MEETRKIATIRTLNPWKEYCEFHELSKGCKFGTRCMMYLMRTILGNQEFFGAGKTLKNKNHARWKKHIIAGTEWIFPRQSPGFEIIR